jgi:hypothetical protein
MSPGQKRESIEFNNRISLIEKILCQNGSNISAAADDEYFFMAYSYKPQIICMTTS